MTINKYWCTFLWFSINKMIIIIFNNFERPPSSEGSFFLMNLINKILIQKNLHFTWPSICANRLPSNVIDTLINKYWALSAALIKIINKLFNNNNNNSIRSWIERMTSCRRFRKRMVISEVRKKDLPVHDYLHALGRSLSRRSFQTLRLRTLITSCRDQTSLILYLIIISRSAERHREQARVNPGGRCPLHTPVVLRPLARLVPRPEWNPRRLALQSDCP